MSYEKLCNNGAKNVGVTQSRIRSLIAPINYMTNMDLPRYFVSIYTHTVYKEIRSRKLGLLAFSYIDLKVRLILTVKPHLFLGTLYFLKFNNSIILKTYWVVKI